MTGIYKITSPSGRIYIGQSIDIADRFRKYRRLRCKPQAKLYNSLVKYGHINHKFEVIAECDIEELNNLERYYQDEYNVLGKKGLNCVLTASSDRSGVIPPETREKLSEAMSGRKLSEEHKKNISKSMKSMSDEIKLRERKSMLGNKYALGNKHKLSIETKEKMSIAKNLYWKQKRSERQLNVKNETE